MTLKKQLTIMATILIAVLAGAWFYVNKSQQPDETALEAAHSEEIHVHSDFLLVLDGQKFDLSPDRYQSTTYDAKHMAFHLHDGVGTMLHRHAEGITMREFLESLDFAISDDCLTTDTGDKYCVDDTNELVVYINGEEANNWPDYVNQQDDQLLLYHGPKGQEVVSGWLSQITDEACIYSGTCPERGDPPHEGCALTCDIR